MDSDACLSVIHLFQSRNNIARSETVQEVLSLPLPVKKPPGLKKAHSEHSYHKPPDLGEIPGGFFI